MTLAATCTLTRRGCEIPRLLLTPEIENALRRELHVMTTNPLAPMSFDLCVPTPHGYIVPQFWGKDFARVHGLPVRDVRIPGTPVLSLEFRGTLRPELHQPAAARAVMDELGRRGGAVLSLPTGFGKTVTALSIIAALKVQTVILVHKNFLAQQWVARAKAHLPMARVTLYNGNVKNASGDIVIATIQTMLSSPAPRLFATRGMCVIDEVHRVAAPIFSKVMCSGGVSTPLVLGLSATPDRTDGLTRLVWWLCGRLAYSVAPTFDAPVSVRICRYHGPSSVPLNRRGDVDHASMLTALAEDEKRTDFVIGEMQRHIGRDTDCLVLSHRRAHCQELTRKLREAGYEAATYIGGASEVPAAMVLVSTYALVSEGFDEPRLDALVLATPASSITQVVGRILRGSTLRPKCILDVVDCNGVCFAQAAKRRKVYVDQKFVVLSASINPVLPQFAFR